MVWLTKVCSQTLHMLACLSQNWSMRICKSLEDYQCDTVLEIKYLSFWKGIV